MVPHFAYNKTTGRNAARPADRLAALILDCIFACILLLIYFGFGIVFAAISYAAPESVYKILEKQHVFW